MPDLAIQQAFDIALRHHQAGRLQEAEDLYRQIIARNPNHAEAVHNMGIIAYQAGRQIIAIELLRRAVALNPALPQTSNSLGMALTSAGRFDEAIAAFVQSIHTNPNFPPAHFNLGIALEQIGEIDSAMAAYRHAISLNPQYTEAHTNLGNALKATGQLDDAIKACRAAIASRPDDAAIAGNLLFTLHFQENISANEIAEEHRLWNERYAEPLKNLIQPHTNDRDPHRRLRIGYVSPDFREHCQAFFTLPLFSSHDRTQVEVFCYCDVPTPDATTRQLQKYADTWRDIHRQTDQHVASLIRQDRIDILIDLTMHMAHNRLLVFAQKPAPIQVTWLAYPASTGLSTIDYRLSDPYLDPEEANDSLYSEKTVRLPNTFWCFDPGSARDIPITPLPFLANHHITFGCLNNFCKINDTTLSLWAEVMNQLPGSRLLLLAPPGAHRKRTMDYMDQKGISPARIEFAPRQSHRTYLGLYHRIDIGLDSFPYNGHTTSLDSIHMGVPVVTLTGQSPVSRAGFSQLSNLGLTELSARTPEQFIAIATKLSADIPKLQTLRSTLRQKMQQSPPDERPPLCPQYGSSLPPDVASPYEILTWSNASFHADFRVTPSSPGCTSGASPVL